MPPGWQIIPDNVLIVRNRNESQHGDFSGLVRAVEGGCLPGSRPRHKTRPFFCAVNLNRGLQINFGRMPAGS